METSGDPNRAGGLLNNVISAIVTTSSPPPPPPPPPEVSKEGDTHDDDLAPRNQQLPDELFERSDPSRYDTNSTVMPKRKKTDGGVTHESSFTTFFDEANEVRLRYRLKRVEQQISCLYGTLYGLCMEKKRAWEGFRKVHPQTPLFPVDENFHEDNAVERGLQSDVSDSEGCGASLAFVQEWRVWMKVVMHPANIRIVELLRTRSHLIDYQEEVESTRVDALICAVVAHISSWKVRIALWDKYDAKCYWRDARYVLTHPSVPCLLNPYTQISTCTHSRGH